MSLAEEIRERLAFLEAESLEVFDDSADHAGHVGRARVPGVRPRRRHTALADPFPPSVGSIRLRRAQSNPRPNPEIAFTPVFKFGSY